MELFSALITPLVSVIVAAAPAILIIFWPEIYRRLAFPKRAHDFEHRLYAYWFDEFVAYGRLVSGDKKKMHFFEKDGKLFFKQEEEEYRGKVVSPRLGGKRGPIPLPEEVQQAYQQHAYKKFEEIVLGGKLE